jgi:hypothetical protein
MCRILNVPRRGYYEWTNNSRRNRAEQDKKLVAMTRTICKEEHNTYGLGVFKSILDRQDIVISRRRTTRLIKEANLVCKTKRKFRATTDSNHINCL